MSAQQLSAREGIAAFVVGIASMFVVSLAGRWMLHGGQAARDLMSPVMQAPDPPFSWLENWIAILAGAVGAWLGIELARRFGR